MRSIGNNLGFDWCVMGWGGLVGLTPSPVGSDATPGKTVSELSRTAGHPAGVQALPNPFLLIGIDTITP